MGLERADPRGRRVIRVRPCGQGLRAGDKQRPDEKWQTAAATRAIPPSPLVAEDVVVVGSRDQKVYWLNRETGEVIDSKDVAGEVLANLLLIEPGEDSNVSEPLVIVSTSAPQELLVAFTLERGQRVWAYGR